jgi:hypothetical protein
VCDTHVPFVPKFVAPTDLTGLVPPITCTRQTLEEAQGLTRVTLDAQLKVLEWLLSLPL